MAYQTFVINKYLSITAKSREEAGKIYKDLAAKGIVQRTNQRAGV